MYFIHQDIVTKYYFSSDYQNISIH